MIIDKIRIVALEKSTSRSKDRRNNILNILSNLESVFTGLYLYYDNKPESEENIAEGTKLGRQRSDEITEKEKMISFELIRYLKRYFRYSGPSDMYKTLNNPKTTQKIRLE